MLTKDRRPYQTRDGYVCALIYTDQQWRRFFKAVPEWAHLADDKRFDEATYTLLSGALVAVVLWYIIGRPNARTE